MGVEIKKIYSHFVSGRYFVPEILWYQVWNILYAPNMWWGGQFSPKINLLCGLDAEKQLSCRLWLLTLIITGTTSYNPLFMYWKGNSYTFPASDGSWTTANFVSLRKPASYSSTSHCIHFSIHKETLITSEASVEIYFLLSSGYTSKSFIILLTPAD